MANDSVMDERTLREIYLTGFEIAVKESKPKTIMSSYNQVNGVYANENEHLLQEILMDEWGFDGMVVSDWGGSNDRVAGLKAGNHLEMPTTGGDSDWQIVQAVRSGALTEEMLNKRVDEYLHVLFECQIPADTPKAFDVEAHHLMARKAAEESIVLLKNKDNILPLGEGCKVAIIGDFGENPRYQGAGSSLVNSTMVESAVEAIKDSHLALVGYEQGFQRNGLASKNGNDADKLEAACKLAKQAEVVLLYLGLDEVSETEGLDRSHMKIAPKQIALLNALYKVNENIVVILSCGAAVELPWLAQCKALVHGYLSGQAGASGMINILTGKANPSGKLAESYPVKLEDTPAYHYFPGREKKSEYREGLFVGYRYYDTAKIPVQMPFGYGLSYTTFEYSSFNITEKEATFTITNTGSRPGAEVAQLYVRCIDSGIFRPYKELKGFTKVYLEPGEEKRVSIPLDTFAFRYFNIKTSQFEIENGIYEILVGASSADIRLKGSIAIKGTTAGLPYKNEELSDYDRGQIQRVNDKEFETLLGHPLSSSKWDRSQMFGHNDTISQMFYAKSLLARVVYKILTGMKNRSEAKGKPDLNILFIYFMPFRGIAKMTGGMVSMEMIDGLLEAINGHFFKGMGKLIGAWRRKGRNKKAMEQALREAGNK